MIPGQGHRLGGGDGDRGGGHPMGYNIAPGGLDFMDDGECSPHVPMGLIAGLILLIILGWLGCASLGGVPPLYLGIKYNHFSKAADTSVVYESGRYFIGPFNKFLLFPATTKTIEFSKSSNFIEQDYLRFPPLHTRTKDGLALHLQISLQYRLDKEKLGRLYNEFNQNYEQVIISSVRDTLIKVASEFEAFQMWEERAKFGTTMQDSVVKELAKAFTLCWGLQLLVIDLPDDVEKRNTVTQVQKQTMFIREQEQLSTQIRAQTKVIEASFAKQEKVLRANGQAAYTVKTKEAQAEATKKTISLEAQVAAMLSKELSIKGDLVSYQRYTALDAMEDANVVYGFQSSPMVQLR